MNTVDLVLYHLRKMQDDCSKLQVYTSYQSEREEWEMINKMVAVYHNHERTIESCLKELAKSDIYLWFAQKAIQEQEQLWVLDEDCFATLDTLSYIVDLYRPFLSVYDGVEDD